MATRKTKTANKRLSRQEMKKTKGGLNFTMGDPTQQALLLPAVQKVREAASSSQ